MHADAISKHNKDGFPDIDSYTALMNACIDGQRRLMPAFEDEGNKTTSDLLNTAATMPKNEQKVATIMELAERAQELLVQMEDISGVSSTRLGRIKPDLRNASLQPTSHHYDCVISTFANATVAAQNTYHTSHLAKNAPHIAQIWLQRMETLSFDPHSGVSPTVDSYFHVMEACVAGATAAKAPIVAQSVFDKLKQNTNIHPTTREYRFLLQIWCGSGHKEAAYKAMGLWMIMQRSFREGVEEMEPTLEDNKMILEAWTRST